MGIHIMQTVEPYPLKWNRLQHKYYRPGEVMARLEVLSLSQVLRLEDAPSLQSYLGEA